MSDNLLPAHRGESRYNSGKGPARKPGDKKKAGAAAGRGYGSDNGEGRGRGRGVSLRIGSGKKGGQAEIMQRRGTLKRRDRSREKALKEERAIERRTVFLPG